LQLGAASAAVAAATATAAARRRIFTLGILLQDPFKLHKKIPNGWAGLAGCVQNTYGPLQVATSLDLSLRIFCNFR
jgi:hypothetical protein